MKYFLLFILVMLCLCKAQCQITDYLVTLSHDTIYGHIRYAYGRASALVNEQDSYPIDENHIESYYLSERNMLLRRKKPPGKDHFSFLTCVELGRINLYEDDVAVSVLGNPSLGPDIVTITYYAEKGSDPLTEVWTNQGVLGSMNKRQKAVLRDLISDNRDLAKTLLQDKHYEAIDVQYYIHQYNQTDMAH